MRNGLLFFIFILLLVYSNILQRSQQSCMHPADRIFKVNKKANALNLLKVNKKDTSMTSASNVLVYFVSTLNEIQRRKDPVEGL